MFDLLRKKYKIDQDKITTLELYPAAKNVISSLNKLQVEINKLNENNVKLISEGLFNLLVILLGKRILSYQKTINSSNQFFIIAETIKTEVETLFKGIDHEMKKIIDSNNNTFDLFIAAGYLKEFLYQPVNKENFNQKMRVVIDFYNSVSSNTNVYETANIENGFYVLKKLYETEDAQEVDIFDENIKETNISKKKLSLELIYRTLESFLSTLPLKHEVIKREKEARYNNISRVMNYFKFAFIKFSEIKYVNVERVKQFINLLQKYVAYFELSVSEINLGIYNLLTIEKLETTIVDFGETIINKGEIELEKIIEQLRLNATLLDNLGVFSNSSEVNMKEQVFSLMSSFDRLDDALEEEKIEKTIHDEIFKNIFFDKDLIKSKYKNFSLMPYKSFVNKLIFFNNTNNILENKLSIDYLRDVISYLTVYAIMGKGSGFLSIEWLKDLDSVVGIKNLLNGFKVGDNSFINEQKINEDSDDHEKLYYYCIYQTLEMDRKGIDYTNYLYQKAPANILSFNPYFEEFFRLSFESSDQLTNTGFNKCLNTMNEFLKQLDENYVNVARFSILKALKLNAQDKNISITRELINTLEQFKTVGKGFKAERNFKTALLEIFVNLVANNVKHYYLNLQNQTIEAKTYISEIENLSIPYETYMKKDIDVNPMWLFKCIIENEKTTEYIFKNMNFLNFSSKYIKDHRLLKEEELEVLSTEELNAYYAGGNFNELISNIESSWRMR